MRSNFSAVMPLWFSQLFTRRGFLGASIPYVFAVLGMVFMSGLVVAKNSEIPGPKPSSSTHLKDRWTMMVGKWLGEIDIKGGGKQKWLVQRFPNGTYKIHFRIYLKDGSVQNVIEAGHWGISGPIYFSINRAIADENGEFRATDPSDPHYYDAYEIKEFTDKILRYRHFETDNEFQIKKVKPDFVLPDTVNL